MKPNLSPPKPTSDHVQKVLGVIRDGARTLKAVATAANFNDHWTYLALDIIFAEYGDDEAVKELKKVLEEAKHASRAQLQPV